MQNMAMGRLPHSEFRPKWDALIDGMEAVGMEAGIDRRVLKHRRLEQLTEIRVVWGRSLIKLGWSRTNPADVLVILQQEFENDVAEETKAERMQEFAATFGSADTNSDGLLDRAEFEDFMGKLA